MNSSNRQYGFVTFFKEDGVYYFQFNGKKGEPILFSHGYQSEKSRDNGIQAVIRSAGNSELYVTEQTKKNEHFFVLKSGNYQEIGRSPLFDTLEEMKEKQEVLKSISKDIPIFEEKERFPEKEKGTSVVPGEREMEAKPEDFGNIPRYKFSIIYYPDSDVWTVKHDLSGDSKKLKSFDGHRVEEFLKPYIPPKQTSAFQATTNPEPEKTMPEEMAGKGHPQKLNGLTHEEVELRLQNIKGATVYNYISNRSDLGAIEVLLKGGREIPCHAFEAKVIAKAVESKEALVIEKKKKLFPKEGRIMIPIRNAQGLKPGMHHFTVTIHQEKEGKRRHNYLGSQLVLLN